MKNLVSLILGLIIGALIMYFYCCNGKVEVLDPDIVKPRGVITPAQARVLDTTFNSRHTLISDEIVERPDNRSVWWSLKDMRDYLKYAYNQSQNLGYTMDGVRIYLGAYPTVDGEPGYTTLFMVPTSSDIGQKGGSGASARVGGGDIPGGPPLNEGDDGHPPSSNYPQ